MPESCSARVKVDVRFASFINSNAAEAMDTPVTGQGGLSDYGSDFSTDEEEILNALLHETSEQGNDSKRDPDLILKDIEDEENPRGAKVLRRQCQQSQDHPQLSLRKTRFEIQLHGGNNPSTNRMYRVTCPE